MKKNIYILLTIFLSLELSFLAHSLVESLLIKYSLSKGIVLSNTNFLGKFYCVLPWWINYGLLLAALIGGYYLGRFWWKIIYIEKRHKNFWEKIK